MGLRARLGRLRESVARGDDSDPAEEMTRRERMAARVEDRSGGRKAAGGSGLASAAKRAGRRFAEGFDEAAPAPKERTDSIAKRAAEAGEARAPVDADLDPGGDFRGIEAFATAGMDEAIEQSGGEPMLDAGGAGGGAGGDPMGLAADFGGEANEPDAVVGLDIEDGEPMGFFGDDADAEPDAVRWF